MPAFPDELAGGPLELRRSRLAFIDDVMNAVAVSYVELHRWMSWCQSMPSRKAMLRFLREDEADFDNDKKWGYSLFEVASGELVGSAGLRRMPDDPDGLEIGYWVRSDRTKLGYASAASRALIDAAFARMPELQRIRISMDAANAASAAVPRKLGFQYLGEVQREQVAEGHSGAGAIWELARPS